MRSIKPPDSHHLSAAIGWLELGNHLEANLDLQKVDALLRMHPDVMEVRWRIYARAKWWEACEDLAKLIIRLAPDRPSGWVYLAYSVRRVRSLMAAWKSLLPAAEKFPGDWLICFNLSCYSCQLGDLSRAREWIEKASLRGDKEKIKALALGDEDLKPIAGEIEAL